jgi:hypothetical protein
MVVRAILQQSKVVQVGFHFTIVSTAEEFSLSTHSNESFERVIKTVRYQNKAPKCSPGATDRDRTHVFDIYLSQT